MAKKIGGTNIIEQHVEKAVLGLAVLVALFFLVNWVFSSPRKIEFSGKASGSPNHAIVLTGWDDSKGAWRLRNSWGTSWGSSGYMWIKYGSQCAETYPTTAASAVMATKTE